MKQRSRYSISPLQCNLLSHSSSLLFPSLLSSLSLSVSLSLSLSIPSRSPSCSLYFLSLSLPLSLYQRFSLLLIHDPSFFLSPTHSKHEAKNKLKILSTLQSSMVYIYATTKNKWDTHFINS